MLNKTNQIYWSFIIFLLIILELFILSTGNFPIFLLFLFLILVVVFIKFFLDKV